MWFNLELWVAGIPATRFFYRLRLAHLREAQVIEDFSVFILHP